MSLHIRRARHCDQYAGQIRPPCTVALPTKTSVEVTKLRPEFTQTTSLDGRCDRFFPQFRALDQYSIRIKPRPRKFLCKLILEALLVHCILLVSSYADPSVRGKRIGLNIVQYNDKDGRDRSPIIIGHARHCEWECGKRPDPQKIEGLVLSWLYLTGRGLEFERILRSAPCFSCSHTVRTWAGWLGEYCLLYILRACS